VKGLVKRQIARALRGLGYEITRVPGARWPRHYFGPSFTPYEVRVPPAWDDLPRIVHVIGNFYTGGSSRLVVDLVERLGDQYAQTILTRDVASPPGYVGLDVQVQPRLGSPDQALRLLTDAMPDLVHVHYLGGSYSRLGPGDWEWYVRLFDALEKLGKPVIENVNIPTSPYVSEAVSCYVFVSDYLRERFGRVRARSVTIYPGSDISAFSRSDTAHIPDDCVGMVYRLEDDKLHPDAIDVFIEIAKRRPSAHALIVGGGPLLQRYQAAVSAAGVQHAFAFTGYVSYEDLRAHYDRMSVFVAPVQNESFGHVVPLAMSMGIPVAGYAAGALPEILDDPTVLAPVGDATTLAAIVCSLLDSRDRRLAMGSAGRTRAVERFSLEAMVRGYAALYADLLSTRTLLAARPQPQATQQPPDQSA
jgi:glycosyltransferase involved in cell wall biosynthesis